MLPKGVTLKLQLIYYKNINSGFIIQRIGQRIINTKLDKARGSKAIYFSTSLWLQDFKNSRIKKYKDSSVQVKDLKYPNSCQDHI